MNMRCPFCLEPALRERYTKKSLLTGEIIYYYRCSACGSYRQVPYPTQDVLDAYYQQYPEIKEILNAGYLDPQGYAVLQKERDMTLQELRFPLERIKNHTNAELGCANGMFLHYLYEKGGRDIIGLDISTPLLEQIPPGKYRIYKGGLEQLPSDSVDNLFLFHILEHLSDMESCFFHLRRVLKEEGLVVLEVPVAGWISERQGEGWRFFMADEHLNIPTYQGLRHFLKRQNIRILHTTRFGSGHTRGSISPLKKAFFDWAAKTFNYGDRIALLLCKDKKI
ncbi:MAG: class I SAM-dependent methyltransferase [Treponemataceae bacterium]|nr:class I SAM-dependent methyltransferase [Treponemataceae bacterium]